MREFMNQVARRAELIDGMVAHVRIGTVDGYNPSLYACKVTLQPDGQRTGWMPIMGQQAGVGWGLQLGPRVGDVAIVLCLEGELEAGVVAGFLYNDTDRPQPVPSGEIWMTHASGSALQFKADGTVVLTSIGALTVNALAGTTWNGNITQNGNLTQNGSTTSAGTVQGANVVGTTDVSGGGKSLKTHVHSGVQPGAGNTGAPV